MRASARSAFRRVTRLYEAFGRLVDSIEDRRQLLQEQLVSSNPNDLHSVEAALDLLRVQVTEQLGTANDAMDDWRDLVPDQVEELERRARERQT
jgi:signal transduction histidine kinase